MLARNAPCEDSQDLSRITMHRPTKFLGALRAPILQHPNVISPENTPPESPGSRGWESTGGCPGIVKSGKSAKLKGAWLTPGGVYPELRCTCKTVQGKGLGNVNARCCTHCLQGYCPSQYSMCGGGCGGGGGRSRAGLARLTRLQYTHTYTPIIHIHTREGRGCR